MRCGTPGTSGHVTTQSSLRAWGGLDTSGVDARTVSAPVQNLDLVPTILDWARTSAPKGFVDGGSFAGILRGVSRTTAEATFGGGVKARGETSKSSLASVRHCARTARRPNDFDPGGATMRSATSRWNISVRLW